MKTAPASQQANRAEGTFCAIPIRIGCTIIGYGRKSDGIIICEDDDDVEAVTDAPPFLTVWLLAAFADSWQKLMTVSAKTNTAAQGSRFLAMQILEMPIIDPSLIQCR